LACGQSVHLATQDAAGLQHPTRLAQVIENHLAAGDVLENGIRINKVEFFVGKHPEVRTRAMMRVRVGRVAQPLLGHPDHFVGHVHPVDLVEMAA